MKAVEAEAFFKKMQEDHSVRIKQVEKPHSIATEGNYRVKVLLEGSAGARKEFHESGFFTTDIDPKERTIQSAAHLFANAAEANEFYRQLERIRKQQQGIHTPESAEELCQREFEREGARLLAANYEPHPPETGVHFVRVTEERLGRRVDSLLRFETREEAFEAEKLLAALSRKQASPLNRLRAAIKKTMALFKEH